MAPCRGEGIPTRPLHFATAPNSTALWSAAGDDIDDFEAVPGLELALGKLGRGDRFPVMFDDDATGEEVLTSQELIE